jgi:16S rRNA (adenine1518-N6/adenine1519-N6)-dimethyltransferase
VRALAASLDIRPTKRRGQNFVIDPNTVQRIARASGVGEGDLVLEVGPGLGSLTLALLDRGARVMAVEIDPLLAGQLAVTVGRHQPENSSHLTVLNADALRVEALPEEPEALVANLPYNIAVPVLLHLLGGFATIREVLVMVQKEVAERLAAEPGSKTYGVPSVKARWFGAVSYAGDVSPHVFWPEPNVDSGLVRITRGPTPNCASTREQVFDVIDAAFAQRRKVLRGALADICGSAAGAEDVLQAADVDPTARGETLSLPDFIRISDALIERTNEPSTG